VSPSSGGRKSYLIDGCDRGVLVVGMVGNIRIKSVLDAPYHLSIISARTMTISFGAVLWLLAVVGDADSSTCLRIGLAINKEPVLALEILYKLYNSGISGRLRHLIGLEPGLIACARFASCKVPGEKKTKPASVGP
jgi:hypothetical protein